MCHLREMPDVQYVLGIHLYVLSFAGALFGGKWSFRVRVRVRVRIRVRVRVRVRVRS